MGTVGYMSPEQAQAKPVDQRSDIFSFGCILYEATIGRKPFAGDSVVAKTKNDLTKNDLPPSRRRLPSLSFHRSKPFW